MRGDFSDRRPSGGIETEVDLNAAEAERDRDLGFKALGANNLPSGFPRSVFRVSAVALAAVGWPK